MGSNFNMVKKPKKDELPPEEEDELEEDQDEEAIRKLKGGDAKDKLVKTMLYIMVGTVVVLLVLYALSLVTTKKYTYEDVENVLATAGQEYFEAHSEYLPTEEGNYVEVDSSNLIYEGKMKEFSYYLKGEEACSGTVRVEKIGSDFVYTPYLNCGNNYNTIELSREITSKNKVVTSGYGLYSMNGDLVFRGESVNNYVQLDNSLWRIVKIDSNDNIVLINSDGVRYNQPWDDRYNDNKLYASGINTYSTSRVKEFLEKIYSKPNEKEAEDILSNHDKAKLEYYTPCVGKRKPDTAVNNNGEECSVKANKTKLGLLTLSDYINASVDPNCKSSTSKSCVNYNYLVIDEQWWLATASTENDYSAYMVTDNGSIEETFTSSYGKIRPVIYLSGSAMFKEGNGTLEKPYVIK